MGLFTKRKPPLPVHDEEVLDLIVEEEGAVLVDFYANWCGPCRQMSGLIKELAHELDGKAEVVIVDVDRAEALARRHGVRSVPTLLVFRDGKPRGRFTGLTDRRRILNALGVEA